MPFAEHPLDGRRQVAVARDQAIREEPDIALVREQAEIDAGRGPSGALTTAEREELTRLRREIRTLKMEREILKKAAAFFAKESL